MDERWAMGKMGLYRLANRIQAPVGREQVSKDKCSFLHKLCVILGKKKDQRGRWKGCRGKGRFLHHQTSPGATEVAHGWRVGPGKTWGKRFQNTQGCSLILSLTVEVTSQEANIGRSNQAVLWYARAPSWTGEGGWISHTHRSLRGLSHCALPHGQGWELSHDPERGLFPGVRGTALRKEILKASILKGFAHFSDRYESLFRLHYHSQQLPK